MLVEQIDQDLQTTLRAPNRDERELSVLRMTKSALMNATIEKRAKAGRDAVLTEEEAISVLQRAIKSLEESVALYRQGGREDLVKQAEEELAIMKKYVPANLTEHEILEIVKKAIAESGSLDASAFGQVMKLVTPQTKGRADGAVVSKIVKELLGAK